MTYICLWFIHIYTPLPKISAHIINSQVIGRLASNPMFAKIDVSIVKLLVARKEVQVKERIVDQGQELAAKGRWDIHLTTKLI